MIRTIALRDGRYVSWGAIRYWGVAIVDGQDPLEPEPLFAIYVETISGQRSFIAEGYGVPERSAESTLAYLMKELNA